MYAPKVIVQNVPKRNVFVKLLFSRSNSFQIWKVLQKLFLYKLTSCNLKIILVAPARVKNFFTFKNKLLKIILAGLVQKYKCACGNIPIMVSPNAIFKSKFVNLLPFHISFGKRGRLATMR